MPEPPVGRRWGRARAQRASQRRQQTAGRQATVPTAHSGRPQVGVLVCDNASGGAVALVVGGSDSFRAVQASSTSTCRSSGSCRWAASRATARWCSRRGVAGSQDVAVGLNPAAGPTGEFESGEGALGLDWVDAVPGARPVWGIDTRRQGATVLGAWKMSRG